MNDAILGEWIAEGVKRAGGTVHTALRLQSLENAMAEIQPAATTPAANRNIVRILKFIIVLLNALVAELEHSPA